MMAEIKENNGIVPLQEVFNDGGICFHKKVI